MTTKTIVGAIKAQALHLITSKATAVLVKSSSSNTIGTDAKLEERDLNEDGDEFLQQPQLQSQLQLQSQSSLLQPHKQHKIKEHETFALLNKLFNITIKATGEFQISMLKVWKELANAYNYENLFAILDFLIEAVESFIIHFSKQQETCFTRRLFLSARTYFAIYEGRKHKVSSPSSASKLQSSVGNFNNSRSSNLGNSNSISCDLVFCNMCVVLARERVISLKILVQSSKPIVAEPISHFTPSQITTVLDVL
ncbi:hypothetical protein RFI_32384 [Reticulomyxa filosa]|uniref:Uncharacterized protein n=1 Tax=Reticulomyxa filosa TaxID=46433 RepID=X6LV46_RETFI|nr:hypothetical protein RFI_32384 [Reticulomyxa filosa]|eukprot:ETO05012.1 hypothetical protein RFI_32384 [Reticulomyxa filosa]